MRALSFGPAAAAYERYRPGYPGELSDVIAACADGPIRTALEIDAGTGKATRLVAGRGGGELRQPPPAGRPGRAGGGASGAGAVRGDARDPVADGTGVEVARPSLLHPASGWLRIYAV
ncbi:putative methyltransferase [Actinoplanes sp. SE50]|uniref:hypothetical protein n=1 Tax=unclassified Actinoplanes TaxID=2626549 RepID=UPI00023EC442|nr:MULTISPECIES: hypothetical protein [unclassified Actinoplanes]AEV83610.1 putative methyltransferase [Actinoplanes sp. SE50/110]ATO82246.1 putative methyltransferase [Actinoplanes sp. SE50]SLL99653.1 methyltransferase [Actinoplanes sp. SE50/110]